MKKNLPADGPPDDDSVQENDPRLLALAVASLVILLGIIFLWPNSPRQDLTGSTSRSTADGAATVIEGDATLRTVATTADTVATAPTLGAAEPTPSEWESLATSDGSRANRRHEAGGVVIGKSLYLLGGRRTPPVERFSSATNGWRNLGAPPMELHHFQPVAIDKQIYVLGAFTCCYPEEVSVQEIHAFDTETETWDVAGTMPAGRARGSSAAIERDGLIYVIGGNDRGHNGGAVPWFDVWNPNTGEWTQLPDAPHARDHFQAALVGDQLVAAGGRRSQFPNTAANPVLPTDVYDFNTGSWRTAGAIPTPRAGTVAAAFGGEAIVLGGEINTNSSAEDTVEAFDVDSDTWRSLPSMLEGRHGSGAGIIDGTLHIVAGATNRGGSGETESHETLDLGENTDHGGSEDDGSDSGAGNSDSDNGTSTGGNDSAGSDSAGGNGDGTAGGTGVGSGTGGTVGGDTSGGAGSDTGGSAGDSAGTDSAGQGDDGDIGSSDGGGEPIGGGSTTGSDPTIDPMFPFGSTTTASPRNDDEEPLSSPVAPDADTPTAPKVGGGGNGFGLLLALLVPVVRQRARRQRISR